MLALTTLAAWRAADPGVGGLCIFRRLTHLECATCGMTRAFIELTRGSWASAAAHHPLAPWLAAEALAVWSWMGTRLTRGLSALPEHVAERLTLANAAVLFAVWLARLATGGIAPGH